MIQIGFIKGASFGINGRAFIVRIGWFVVLISAGSLKKYEPPRCPNCREVLPTMKA